MQSIKPVNNKYDDPAATINQALDMADEVREPVWVWLPAHESRVDGVLLVFRIAYIPAFRWLGSGIEFAVSTEDAFKYLRGEK